MAEYLIGMHGGFDYKKFARDFREGFYGFEACLFANDKDINNLLEEVNNNKLKFGVHFPLRRDIYKYRDPLFLSLDDKEALEAMEAFESELEFVKTIDADYLLVHFPKPVIKKENISWEHWRFGSDKEWVWEKDYPFEVFKIKCEELFEKLSELSNKYNTKIVLEHDAVNKYIYESSLLEDLLNRYSNLKMCLDFGRLHMLEQIDSDFDSKEFIKKMAPYTYLIHLWNDKLGGSIKGGHLPVLPELKKEDGFADIHSYLSTVSDINKNVKVLFEHRSDLVSDDELERCYDWVKSYFIV